MRPSLRDRMTSQVTAYMDGSDSWRVVGTLWRTDGYPLRKANVEKFSRSIGAIDGDFEAHIGDLEHLLDDLRDASSSHTSSRLERLIQSLQGELDQAKLKHALVVAPAFIPLPVSPVPEAASVGAVEEKRIEFKPELNERLLTEAGAKAFASRDYYHRLSLEDDATPKAVKHHYRVLVRLYHPDKNPGNAQAKHVFAAISEANECLQDPVSRLEYDRQLVIERLNPSAFATFHQQRHARYRPNPKIIGAAVAALSSVAAASAKRPGATAAVLAGMLALGYALFVRSDAGSIEDTTDAHMPGKTGFTL